MNNLKKKVNYEDEKGAITLFVLTAIIFFIVVISGIYINISNKGNSQGKDIQKIQKDYIVTKNDMDYEYDSLFMKENTTKTDLEGNKYIIPAGFRKTGETDKVKEGIVIQDKTGSEFVWVPVPDISVHIDKVNKRSILWSWTIIEGEPTNEQLNGSKIKHEGQYYSGYREVDIILGGDGSGKQQDNNINNLKKLNENLGINLQNAEDFKKYMEKEWEEIYTSIEINKGFYIGRYETGDWKKAKVTSKKGNKDINYQTWYDMYFKQKQYADKLGETSIRSNMIYGFQWDATCKWISTSEDEKVKKSVVNCIDSEYANNSGSIKETGSMKPINNIYDMTGNVFDWTAEAHMIWHRTLRGTHYSSSLNNPITARSYQNLGPHEPTGYIGSRLSLYL